jgi:trans-aconitate methyltransferase
MDLNNWNIAEVNRAENSWGKVTPSYSVDMFNFIIKDIKSWLDLGCGFGRFLNYLINSQEDPDYIGYDSSLDMVKRIREKFPTYASRVFQHNITQPIVNHQEAIICSAVLIHITKEDQNKVLKNIALSNPQKVTFDINCPEKDYLDNGGKDFYKIIRGAEGSFRMTWQSHHEMTKKVTHMFRGYKLATKSYTINKTRNKVIYMLRRDKS